MCQDYLSLSFSPSRKFLSAIWQRPVSSEEYRHGIRTIAVCINALGVQYLVTDLSALGTPSVKDQHSTANFLRQALKNTSLMLSARVLSQQKSQWISFERVFRESRALPYETQVFKAYDQAIAWLFGRLGKYTQAPDDMISLPMPCNSYDLRKLLNTRSTGEPVESGTANAEDTKASIRTCYTDFVVISINLPDDLLVVRWLRPVESREYRYGILKAGRALRTYQLSRMMINNNRMGVLTLDDQRWLLNVSVEILSSCRLKRMAIISSSDTLQQMVNEKVGDKVRGVSLFYQSSYFMSEDEALEWLMLPENENRVRY